MAEPTEYDIAYKQEQDLHSQVDVAEYAILIETRVLANTTFANHPEMAKVRELFLKRDRLQSQYLKAMLHTSEVATQDLAAQRKRACLEASDVH